MKYYILFISLFLFAACSSTKEISVLSTETTTIEKIKVDVPPVAAELVIPKIYSDPAIPDTTAYGYYEGERVIEQKNPDGTKTEARIKAKITVKKASGKPVADVKMEVQQSPIEKPAKVVNKVETVSQQKETTGFGEYFKYFCYIMFVLVILTVISYIKGLFPFKRP